jgi:elongation factor Ts
MAEITVALIKTLRDKTNAGMMDCKAALKEADGDLDAAETVLRKKGIASADKKASRATKEGVIAAKIDDASKVGVLVEVSCETDFVAKNDNFQGFVSTVLDHLAANEAAESAEAMLDQSLAAGGTVGDLLKSKITELGENMLIPRFTRYALGEQGGSAGVVASYIHMQGKVGVLIEVNTESDAAAQNEGFREMVKDITLHIAAAQPICINRDEVPADKLATEREIYLDQVKGKPENIIEKIVEGKIDKYLSGICLLEQGFVKDPDKTIKELLAAKSKALGEEIVVRRFVRYAIGELAGE